MRRILVDFARARDREKRGGDALRVSLTEAANVPAGRSAELVALDEALQTLEKLAPRQARMVELLYTTGAGTSPAQMVYGFRALGLEATKVQHADRDLAKVNPPAILLVDVGDEPDAHVVAYMGRKGDLFEIWYPGSGRGGEPALRWCPSCTSTDRSPTAPCATPSSGPTWSWP